METVLCDSDKHLLTYLHFIRMKLLLPSICGGQISNLIQNSTNTIDQVPGLFIGITRWSSPACCTTTLPHCSARRTKQNVFIDGRLQKATVLDSTADRLPQLTVSGRLSRLMSAVTVGDCRRRVDAVHHWHWWTIFISSSSCSSSGLEWRLGLLTTTAIMPWHPPVLHSISRFVSRR